jgi:hypothetical protein
VLGRSHVELRGSCGAIDGDVRRSVPEVVALRRSAEERGTMLLESEAGDGDKLDAGDSRNDAVKLDELCEVR